MHKHFYELEYTRETYNYARFRVRNQNPDDPQPLIYPVMAREQGTIIGREQIIGLLQYFTLKEEKLRYAYNTWYELSPPTAAAADSINT